MPQFAQFDHTVAAPAPVIGWYDTDALNYGNLPVSANLLSVTAAQWWARLANPSGWAVSGGALVPYTAPVQPATLAQQATAALSAGAAVTSAGTPALTGTYDISAVAQGRMAAVSVYILVNSKFPGGATSYAWMDTAGAPHVFPNTAAFQAFATAIADHVSVLIQIIATGAGTLPPATVSIA